MSVRPFFSFLRSGGSRGRVTFGDEVESVISTARLRNAGGLAAGFESRRFVMQCLSTVPEQTVLYLVGLGVFLGVRIVSGKLRERMDRGRAGGSETQSSEPEPRAPKP